MPDLSPQLITKLKTLCTTTNGLSYTTDSEGRTIIHIYSSQPVKKGFWHSLKGLFGQQKPRPLKLDDGSTVYVTITHIGDLQPD